MKKLVLLAASLAFAIPVAIAQDEDEMAAKAKVAGTLVSSSPSTPLMTAMLAILAQQEKTVEAVQQKPAAPSIMWEFRLEQNLSQEACNKLGGQGWELVGYSV